MRCYVTRAAARYSIWNANLEDWQDRFRVPCSYAIGDRGVGKPTTSISTLLWAHDDVRGRNHSGCFNSDAYWCQLAPGGS